VERWLPYFLLLHFAAFIGLAFIFASYRTWKRTGVNPYRFGRGDSAHDMIGRAYRGIMVVLAISLLLRCFAPEIYSYTAPLTWLEVQYVQIASVTILLAALIWICVAQVHMSDSWRIGVDHENRTKLVTNGLFSVSRNPVFVGMRLTLFGLFLGQPNALTLACFLTADVLIQVQVRLEEEHLSQLHGAAFDEYRRRVRRWL
jgi:protein-S-isoprenylcysteine O-methyltransferase Ste14